MDPISENLQQNVNYRLFCAEEIDRIRNLEFMDIIDAVTNLSSSDMQTNVFKLPTEQGTLFFHSCPYLHCQ